MDNLREKIKKKLKENKNTLYGGAVGGLSGYLVSRKNYGKDRGPRGALIGGTLGALIGKMTDRNEAVIKELTGKSLSELKQ